MNTWAITLVRDVWVHFDDRPSHVFLVKAPVHSDANDILAIARNLNHSSEKNCAKCFLHRAPSMWILSPEEGAQWGELFEFLNNSEDDAARITRHVQMGPFGSAESARSLLTMGHTVDISAADHLKDSLLKELDILVPSSRPDRFPLIIHHAAFGTLQVGAYVILCLSSDRAFERYTDIDWRQPVVGDRCVQGLSLSPSVHADVVVPRWARQLLCVRFLELWECLPPAHLRVCNMLEQLIIHWSGSLSELESELNEQVHLPKLKVLNVYVTGEVDREAMMLDTKRFPMLEDQFIRRERSIPSIDRART